MHHPAPADPLCAYGDEYLLRAASPPPARWGLVEPLCVPDPELGPDAEATLRRLLKGR